MFPRRRRAGGISLVSQSGGLLNSFAELTATNRGIGVNYLVSSGNEAGLEMADYIAYLADDPGHQGHRTASWRAPRTARRFRAAVEAAARRKPMVVLASSAAANSGQRATLAHTGTLAGRHEAFAGAVSAERRGAGGVPSTRWSRPPRCSIWRAAAARADRVVMMTVSGGATSLIGDLGEAAGINFPAICEPTNRRVQTILGVERCLRQSARYRRFAAAAPRRQHHRGAAGPAGGRRHRPDRARARHAGGWLGLPPGALVDRLATAAREADKPVLLVSFMSNSLTRHWQRSYARSSALPLLEDLERGLNAIRHLVDYAAFPPPRRRRATPLPRQAGPRAPMLRRSLQVGCSPSSRASKFLPAPACRSPASCSRAALPRRCGWQPKSAARWP